MDADKAAEKARQEEVARAKAEADRITEEELKREADIEHKKLVFGNAKLALVEICGLSDDQARKAVLAIHKAMIPSVSIRF